MRLTEYVHLCLETRLKNGDSVLDATAGNGYDALKAAELVQPNGNVSCHRYSKAGYRSD